MCGGWQYWDARHPVYFKCFTREAGLEICQRLTRECFGFAVEMPSQVCQLDYRVRAVPMAWRNVLQLRVHLLCDAS